ncbi:DUF1493 family protein [Shimwellia blattae]|nr:DUF1493 family protein [Shimwellia blattae]VDY66252.1 Protein of uncharacterised function (DUF1493) [Shimwellia blattae]VEC27521.1 Protein of uncharacterised function (DUF1493) [Shimwellia blattae]
MNIQDAVLALFREEIPGYLDKHWQTVPLTLDSDLFDVPGDDLSDALQRFEICFNVDLSVVDWSKYFPWENTPVATKWFGPSRKDVEATRQPLTIKMFAESARAGKWLYD